MGGFFINLKALARLDYFLATVGLTPLEFMVGSALCRYMGDRDECWPTREEISCRTGIRRIPTISAAIAKLVKIGFIDQKRTQRGVRYWLRCDDSDVTPTVTPEVGEEIPDVTLSVTPELSDVTPSVTPGTPHVTPSVTSESSLENPHVTPSVTSDVTPTVTPYTLHENKKVNSEVASFSSYEAEQIDNPSSKAKTPPPSPAPAADDDKADAPDQGKGKPATGAAKKSPKPRVTFDGETFVVPPVQMAAWKTAYPRLDVEAEIARSCAWFISDGQKKKALGKFIHNWLGRAKPATGTAPQEEPWTVSQEEFDAMARRAFATEEEYLAFVKAEEARNAGNQ